MKNILTSIFIVFLLGSCTPSVDTTSGADISESSTAYTELDYTVKQVETTTIQFAGKPFPVSADNCGGIEPSTQTTTRSQKFSTELDMVISSKVTAELGGDFKIVEAVLSQEIGIALGIAVGIEREISSSIETITPPGTKTTAMLEWKAELTKGDISIIRPDGSYVDILPFAVLNSLNLEQQNIETIDCETGEVISQSPIEQILPTAIPNNPQPTNTAFIATQTPTLQSPPATIAPPAIDTSPSCSVNDSINCWLVNDQNRTITWIGIQNSHANIEQGGMILQKIQEGYTAIFTIEDDMKINICVGQINGEVVGGCPIVKKILVSGTYEIVSSGGSGGFRVWNGND